MNNDTVSKGGEKSQGNFKYIWVVFSFIFTLSPLFGGTPDAQKIWPLPVAEAEHILLRWLIAYGFEASRSYEEDHILLRASRENEAWQIILKSHSPLASSIWVRYTLNRQPDLTKSEALFAYLENYLKSLPPEEKSLEQGVPNTVLSKRDSIVCIKATAGDEAIQFTGFIIDKKGSIISTAHDLKGIQEVAVILSNGQEVQGRLLKREPDRDLALIRINSESTSFIPLVKIRTNLDAGIKVYSVGCPMNHQKMIYPGVIERLLKQVNALPLWQVAMEILPGSSGSPVFDAQGNLVGVVKGRYRGTDSMGFLIPADQVVKFLKGE